MGGRVPGVPREASAGTGHLCLDTEGELWKACRGDLGELLTQPLI